MQILRKYKTLVFLCVISLMMFGAQIFSQFFYTANIHTILQNRTADLQTLFISLPATNTMVENEYFSHAVPTGMQIFAVDKNNFKSRYEQLFFEVHIFTSKIDSLAYSKTKYPTETLYSLPVTNADVFFYTQELGNNVIQLAMYSSGIEVTVNTTPQMMEQALLKSAEVIRNTTPIENNNNSIYIGGNSDQSSQSSGGSQLHSDETSEENNNEMPIVKE